MTLQKNAYKTVLHIALVAVCTGVVGTTSLHALGAPASYMGHDRGGPEKQQGLLEHITRELSLTRDQVTQVKDIQAKAPGNSNDGIDKKSEKDRSKRGRMRGLTDDQEVKIRTLLTNDQKIKFDTLLNKKKKNR